MCWCAVEKLHTHVAARRLDRTRNDGNPRLLLVVLTTSADASTLLALSHQFRSSSDDHIRRNLYFNPDETKQEAQIAYEERVRRRQARATKNTYVEGHQEVHLTSSMFTSSLRPTAPPFPSLLPLQVGVGVCQTRSSQYDYCHLV